MAMAPGVVPTLAAFLMLDNNDTVVGPDTVEDYVRRFAALDARAAEVEAAQIMGCMAAGNVVVVRAVMLSLLDRYKETATQEDQADVRRVPDVV